MTSSLLDVRRGAQTPRVSTSPAVETTSGSDAADLADAAGLVLDPWQRHVLDLGLGERPDGRWASLQVACWVPRQNGKGAIIEARVLAGLFLFGERKILWTAHEYKTAQEGFLRIRELIQGTPDFDRLVKRYWEGSGEQGVELVTGQRLKFIARSGRSGRGFTGDLIVLDEAQELTLLQMKALFSTMSAKSVSGNPQVWYFGTPPENPDAWVYGLRRDGERGKDRLTWVDWGLGQVDLNEPVGERMKRYADRELWYRANPGLGIRISEEFCEDELSTLKEGFAPERLGLWLPPADDGTGVLDMAAWAAMLDAESRRAGGVALAVDVTPMRDHASIGLYGLRADGLEHVQLTDYRPGPPDWIPERLAELREVLGEALIGVALDERNGAHALLPALAEVGITPPEDPEQPRRGDLLVMDTRAAADATSQFIDAYREGGLRQIGQAPMDAAVRNAKTRPIGDAGQIAWGRRASEVDIGPLQVATGARYCWHAWVDLVSSDYDVLASVW